MTTRNKQAEKPWQFLQDLKAAVDKAIKSGAPAQDMAEYVFGFGGLVSAKFGPPADDVTELAARGIPGTDYDGIENLGNLQAAE